MLLATRKPSYVGAVPLDPNPRSPRSVASSWTVSKKLTDVRLDDQELRDAVARVHVKGVMTVGVEQDDAHLAAIAGVDEARRVDQGDTVLGGEAGARQREGRDPRRQTQSDAGADHLALLRRHDRVLDREEVEGGVAVVGALRQARTGGEEHHGDLQRHARHSSSGSSPDQRSPSIRYSR